ncbi:MAG: phenylalanine--tRNA ligase subunit beta [Flavobacteriales bacterium]|nr:phenylalanine--tRNA ligase subunit beta [Flavobacteriales bacterium]
MKISWNWLRTLVDVGTMSPAEAAEVLTSTGLEVESVHRHEPVQGMLEGVVVGHVVERTKHPDADRLSLCKVDVGSGELLDIVCGAANVAQGQKVLVATVGSTLYPASGEPLTIKRAKIRGAVSNGMICAEDELGLGTSHEGILVLDPSAEVGRPAADLLGLEADHVLEIGLTPNRSDALGHLGVARDLRAAVTYRTGRELPLKRPDVSAFTEGSEGPVVAVSVEAPETCPRYAGLTLAGVRVGPSPEWLKARLQAIGLRPINNVVDVTNYVQHELGQPLHAFDADKLAGGRIIVGHLPEGSPFTTLDGVERKLSAGDLMIRDAEGGACIAGVFGGLHSGVTEGTTRIFLESACFDAVSVRRTARRHGLHTDASFRFERGVDPELTVYALKRAALLLGEVAGARVVSPVTDIISKPATWVRVKLRVSAVQALSGIALGADEVVRALELLEHRIVQREGDVLVVEVPPYRVDVTREADLVEEVLRIHGLDAVPLPERLMSPPALRTLPTADGLQDRLHAELEARGFTEVMTSSLVSAQKMLAIQATTAEHLVRLRNPLSSELDVMRPTLLTGLLATVAHNRARQRRDMRLFESGRVYRVEKGHALRETPQVVLALTGRFEREGWRSATRDVEVADLRAEVEALAMRFGLPGARFVAVPHPLLHEAVELVHRDVPLAVLGQVHAHVARAFDVEQTVFVAELQVDAWVATLGTKPPTYQEVPRFPAVRRDLSLLLDEGVTFVQLEQLARDAERLLLREVGLFDVYQGDKLPKGKKSYALSFILQDRERTLTDELVDKAMGRIRSALEKGVGAELRG